MKIAMINASPRLMIRKNDASVTNIILRDVRRIIRRKRGHELEDHHLKTDRLPDEEIKELMDCDIWVIGYPVFESGLPSHLLSFMERIEKKTAKGEKEIQIYGIGHTGLYEGSEVFPSLHSLARWCEHCHFSYGGGLGVGADISHLPMGVGQFVYGRRRSYLRKLTVLGEAVSDGAPVLNAGCTTDMSRKTYVLWHNRFVRREARQNGLKAVDIAEKL